MKLDLTSLWYQEVDLIGINTLSRETWQGKEVDTFDITIELLRQGQLTIDGLITYRFELDQWREAINTATDKQSGSIKVVFDFLE